MVSRIRGLGLLFRYRGQQEDAAHEFVRPSPVRQGDVGVIVRPIGGRRDRLFVRQLQCLDASDDLIHVPAHAGGVIQAQHEFVLRIDNKDGADRQRKGLIARRAGINHPVCGADGPVAIADNGEFDLDFILAVSNDVTEPLLVGLDRVYGQRRNEAIHVTQFVVLHGQTANFGRTNGCRDKKR